MNKRINSQDSYPKNWIFTSLGNIAEINPKSLEVDFDDMEVSFLPMKSVEERTGKIDLSQTKKVSQVKKWTAPYALEDFDPRVRAI